jgi:hypothetical protein
MLNKMLLLAVFCCSCGGSQEPSILTDGSILSKSDLDHISATTNSSDATIKSDHTAIPVSDSGSTQSDSTISKSDAGPTKIYHEGEACTLSEGCGTGSRPMVCVNNKCVYTCLYNPCGYDTDGKDISPNSCTQAAKVNGVKPKCAKLNGVGLCLPTTLGFGDVCGLDNGTQCGQHLTCGAMRIDPVTGATLRKCFDSRYFAEGGVTCYIEDQLQQGDAAACWICSDRIPQ